MIRSEDEEHVDHSDAKAYDKWMNHKREFARQWSEQCNREHHNDTMLKLLVEHYNTNTTVFNIMALIAIKERNNKRMNTPIFPNNTIS